MASTEVEQPVNNKNNTTCVLRVSIHCEGCKRKVKKLIQSLPGVDDIEIDRQRQRVVVTGDVSTETLLRKLVKSGKHAELWPENTPPNSTRKTEKVQNNEENVVSGKEIKPPPTKSEDPAADSSKSGDSGVIPAGNHGGRKVDDAGSKKIDSPGGRKFEDGGHRKVSDGGGRKVGDGGDRKVSDGGGGKVAETELAGNQGSTAVGEKKEKQTENSGGDGGGGGEKKKKKKKEKEKEGQNGNNNETGETSSSSTQQPQGTSTNTTTIRSSNGIPPRHHGYKYPEPYHHAPPPAPVYTVSYNTAHHPVSSYTASYYAAPPQPSQSYAYSHYGYGMGPQQSPPAVSDYSQQQPLDSFEMFSDENPNGCLVM